jgi:LysM domain
MILVLPGQKAVLRYVVAPGDTLSGIAAALGVRGGWPALYAANRAVIGPDPALIRPGTVLAAPPATAGKAPPGQPGATGSAPATGGAAGTASPGSASPGGTPAAGAPSPGGTAGGTPAAPAAPAAPGAPQAAGVMPRWLKGTLLVVALLVLTAFLAPPAAAAGQRRRRALREHAARRPGRGQRAARKMARFVQADHERLIVTYSISDDTVYLLTPPGEDPRSVLRAARLVLPEDTYQDLAGHLGAPPGWLRE